MSEPRDAGPTCCPHCGAAWTPGMAQCGGCGRAIEAWPQGEASGAPMPWEPASVALAPVAQAGPAAPAEGEQRCAWCGTANAADAERCVKCNAAFPRPEQDEAIRRASEARIREANDSIAALQRQRARRGLGRLFGR